MIDIQKQPLKLLHELVFKCIDASDKIEQYIVNTSWHKYLGNNQYLIWVDFKFYTKELLTSDTIEDESKNIYLDDFDYKFKFKYEGSYHLVLDEIEPDIVDLIDIKLISDKIVDREVIIDDYKEIGIDKKTLKNVILSHENQRDENALIEQAREMFKFNHFTGRI